jgi:hypothetical protein
VQSGAGGVFGVLGDSAYDGGGADQYQQRGYSVQQQQRPRPPQQRTPFPPQSAPARQQRHLARSHPFTGMQSRRMEQRLQKHLRHATAGTGV